MRINIGGKIFFAGREVLIRSPVIREALRYSREPFIDRDPAVFHHVLTWMRHNKLYIDHPDAAVYEQLCDDARAYGLADLSDHVSKRINLCSHVYLQGTDGCEYCSINVFRRLDMENTLIKDILDGCFVFLDRKTIGLDVAVTPFRPILRYPFAIWKRCMSTDEIRHGVALFGKNLTITKENNQTFGVYHPIFAEIVHS